jgi:hypothetical protein
MPEFSFSQKTKYWLSQQGDVLLRVLKSHGLFVVAGFLLGVLFVIVSKFIPFIWEFIELSMKGKSTASLIVKETGVGLIVASIAVFGYEWRSHSKHALELSQKLEKMLAAKGEEALDESLTALLSGDEDTDLFRENIIDFVKTANNLSNKQTPDTVQYLRVLSWIFDQTVKKNAGNLVGLVEDDAGAEWHYNVPKPAEVAGRILGAQIKVLSSGDSYDSISTVDFWRDDSLDYFFNKTKEAVTRNNVIVRRIFNLCNINDLSKEVIKAKSNNKKGKPYKVNEVIKKKLDSITNILERHKELADQSNGNYKIQFLSSFQTAAIIDTQTEFSKKELEDTHFGLFRNSSSKQIIKFVAETTSLSKMGLGYCHSKDKEVKMFEVLWKASSEEDPFEVLLPKKANSDSNNLAHQTPSTLGLI